MNIIWEVSEFDIKKVIDFVNEHKNPSVENRINRNVNRKDIQINRDTIIKEMLMCLLTPQQISKPVEKIRSFFGKEPFLLTYQFLSKEPDIEDVLRNILKLNGLTPYFNKIPKHFTYNFWYLEETDWALQTQLLTIFENETTKQIERELADNIDKTFKGFGSSHSRLFLQELGLTKYEIPIDSRILHWMKDFGFSIKFSTTALRDTSFYHFISDGIQLLCEKANIYPCVLDAAILARKNGEKLTKDS